MESTKVKCGYCASEYRGDKCPGCGARWSEPAKPEWNWALSPYYMSGYMVWVCSGGMLDERRRAYFFDGKGDVVEVLEFNRQWLEQNVKPWEDCTQMIWDLFCVSHFGEKKEYKTEPPARTFRLTVEAMPAEEPYSVLDDRTVARPW